MRDAEMDIRKLLSHPYINKAAVAADLFPNQKYPKQTLSNKLNGVMAGTGRQRMTDRDIQGLYELFEKFREQVTVATLRK